MREIPEFLIRKINEQYNKEEVEVILEGLRQQKKTTFRVNRIKSTVKDIEQVLHENKIEFSKDSFLEDAFILNEEKEDKLREFDIYKEGKIYLQSLSSMIPVIILDPREKENILDMCAAPRRKNNSNCKSYR